jgi:hypothetical protein
LGSKPMRGEAEEEWGYTTPPSWRMCGIRVGMGSGAEW